MRTGRLHIQLLVIFSVLSTSYGFSQEDTAALEEIKQQAIKAAVEANNYVYEGNERLTDNEFVEAEAEYRKAISRDAKNANAPYNLGNAYYNNENMGEAFGRYQQAAKVASEKEDKHSAYHNMGNVFMKNKEYEKAVEAYKNALRNNPNDEETRYNYALAKELLEKENQGGGGDNDQNQDQNQDQDQNKDQNKEGDNKDQEGDQEEQDNQDQNDKEGESDEDKEGENEQDQDKGDDKEDKKDEKEGGDQPKDQPQQPRPNQLSPQQVQNLLEAANNEENKVQDKINLQKAKGAKVKTEKDW